MLEEISQESTLYIDGLCWPLLVISGFPTPQEVRSKIYATVICFSTVFPIPSSIKGEVLFSHAVMRMVSF